MKFDEFIGLIDYIGCVYLHKYGEGLIYCTHPCNPNEFEGNCNFDLCPIKHVLLRAKKELDEFDPFFREEDYD